MATVEKRGDTYRIRVSVGYDAQGKQLVKSMTWKPPAGMTKKQLEKELERQKVLFEEQVKSGQYIDCNIKFETLANQWLEQVEKEGNLKPRTLDRWRQCAERTYAAIGHLRVGRITTMQIQQFINNLAEDGQNKITGKGLSTKTQKLYLCFVSDVLNYAVRCNMITHNPCRGVQTISMPPKEREVYTLEEAQSFLEKLQTAPMKYRAFFTLAIFTGFRRGELLGLEWSDVNFDTGVVTVCRTSQYLKDKGIFEGTPKTKSSLRSLKVPAQVVDLLRQHKSEQNAERLRLGDSWVKSNRLFTTWNGSPMSPNAASIWLAKFCKGEGLRYVNVHSFRHLNATLLINCGIDVKSVSAALGHSQATTTLNIYAHSFAEAQARASDALADAFNLDIAAEKKKA